MREGGGHGQQRGMDGEGDDGSGEGGVSGADDGILCTGDVGRGAALQ